MTEYHFVKRFDDDTKPIKMPFTTLAEIRPYVPPELARLIAQNRIVSVQVYTEGEYYRIDYAGER